MECLFRQDYSNFEIILVDDGSTDRSGQLCDSYSDKYDNVYVLHKKNEGSGSARNTGIENARGKYIYCFDIDDRIDSQLLEYCVKQMEDNLLDMLIFGFETIDVQHGHKSETITFRERQIQSNDDLKKCYVDNLLLVRNGNGFVWNKFYRKEFLDRYNLRFENQRIQQDEVFNLLVYPHLNRAYISPEILYTYYIYDKGNTRSRFIPDRFDIYVSVRDHFEHLKCYWRLDDERMDCYLHKRFWSSIITGAVPNMFHPDCPWNRRHRRIELEHIATHPYTHSCLQYMNNNVHDIENRMYLYALKRRSLWTTWFVYWLFGGMRKIKHTMQNWNKQHTR